MDGGRSGLNGWGRWVEWMGEEWVEWMDGGRSGLNGWGKWVEWMGGGVG